MAKIGYPDLGNLTANDLDSLQKAVVIPTKEALRQVRQALTGNLTVANNSYAAIVTLGLLGNNSTQTLVHGVEYLIQSPLKTTPIGFTPIKCFDANGVALALPQCTYNTSRTDGYLGITPTMALPVGYCQLSTATPQSMTSSGDFAAVFSASQYSSGNLTFNGTNGIVAAKAGIVLANYQAPWSISTAGTYRQAYLSSNGTTTRYATLIELPSIAQAIRLASAAMWDVVAGQTIQLFLGQDTGGALNTGAQAAIPVVLAAKYVDVIPGTQCNLVGILWGG